MSRNKLTAQKVTDRANDSRIDQSLFEENNFNGTTLGDFTSNDSTLQRHYDHYQGNKPNVQSAIETLITTSQIPINGIYTSSVSTDPNDSNAYQIDEIVMEFIGGEGVIATDVDIVGHMYGILFDIPAGSEVSNIKPILEQALNNSGLFQSVIVITNDNLTFPTITVTVSHRGITPKIPAYVASGGVHSQTFNIIKFTGNISQTSGDATKLGYGTWTYLGFESKTLSEGTENIHYFRRDA